MRPSANTLPLVIASLLLIGATPATLPSISDESRLLQTLRRSIPDPRSAEQISHLIAQLADPDFRLREEATEELGEWPNLDPAVLDGPAGSPDPELRRRAVRVRQRVRRSGDGQLLAALHAVRRRRIASAVPLLIELAPHCRSEATALALRHALGASAGPDDVAALRAATKAENADVRAAAATALGAVLGGKAGEELRPLTHDSSPRVRLAAAEYIAGLNDHSSLPILGELLGCDDRRTRREAATALVRLTGRQFDFRPSEDPASQKATLELWQAWIAKEGPSVRLRLPLGLGSEQLGRTLICHQSAGRVYELDEPGHETFSVNVRYPWGCEGLPNGHRLVALWQDRAVVEYDESGKEVWRRENLPGGPTRVRRLENGHTLVPCSDAQQVIEIDSAGNVVWQFNMIGRPTDAQRLDNGNTLISLHQGNRVVEVDRTGKVVWQLGPLLGPVQATRLENGDTLVCLAGAGQVQEFDVNGRKVWELNHFTNPWDAQRLEDGTTLVADRTGIHQFSPDGRLKWETPHGERAFRY